MLRYSVRLVTCLYLWDKRYLQLHGVLALVLTRNLKLHIRRVSPLALSGMFRCKMVPEQFRKRET